MMNNIGTVLSLVEVVTNIVFYFQLLILSLKVLLSQGGDDEKFFDFYFYPTIL